MTNDARNRVPLKRRIQSTKPSCSPSLPHTVNPQLETAQNVSAGSAEPIGDNPSSPLNTQAEHEYDAFISYSHTDQGWVRNELLPRLEKDGLKVIIDYRDFEPGAPLVKEIERAVLASRKTMLVLTPAYLDSEWTRLENFLVQTLDPGARQRRLLPIVLKPCEIPLHIRALVYIDFTLPEAPGTQFQRILNAINTVAKMVSSPSDLPRRDLQHNGAGRGDVMEEPQKATAYLDSRILETLYEYLRKHRGKPQMDFGELARDVGAERADVIECLMGLKEHKWLEYNLTEGAEGGLVWLTSLGIKVAKDVRRN